MADPTNKSYDGIITWAKASDNDIKAKQLATPRNITITNNGGTSVVATAGSFDGTGTATIKLKDPVVINITGNVTGNVTGNCSGSSGSCTGNSASSTYANNIRISQDVGAKWRPLLLATDHTTGANQAPLVSGNQKSTSPAVADISLRAYTDANATATGQEKRAILCIGNNISNTDTENNNYKYSKYGQLYMYGTGKGYTIIKPSYNADSSITLNLPSGAGTLARTSDDITGNAATATRANSIRLTQANTSDWRPLLAAESYAINTDHSLFIAGVQKATSPAVTDIPLNVRSTSGDGNLGGISGVTTLAIGNNLSINDSTNNNYKYAKRGCLYIYGEGKGSTIIKPGYNADSSIIITLPDSSGTLALANQGNSVVSQWVSTGNWYRLWEDGTIEQGGRISIKLDDTYQQIVVFEKPYTRADTIYIYVSTTRHLYGDAHVIGVREGGISTTAFCLKLDRWANAGAGNTEILMYYAIGM